MKSFKMLMPFFCAATLVYSGCAKQQTVKADLPIAPAAPAPAAAATAQKEQPAAAKQEAAVSNAAVAVETPQAQPRVAEVKGGDISHALESVYFDFDSAVLSDAARAALAANFEKLKGNPQAALRVEGHSDERGSDEYNLALSERRAQAAVKYLEALGFPAERLKAVGYGEEKPAVAGESEEAWAKNRRDEFLVGK